MDRKKMARRSSLAALFLVGFVALSSGSARAQQARPSGAAAAHDTTTAKTVVEPPAGYVIGPEDVLSIVFWRDKDMSTQVTVRPDGKISLPLLDEVQAAGLT